MPTKRGVRSRLRREFRVVRATALRKLRGPKVNLSIRELEVLAEQIRADLHRIDGDGARTAPGSHCPSATAHERHDGPGQEACAGNPAKRHPAGGNERNPDGTPCERVKNGSEQVRVARSKDSPQGATLRRSDERRGKPSSSNGELTSSHRTGSIASFWRKSTTPPKMFETSSWTSRTKS